MSEGIKEKGFTDLIRWLFPELVPPKKEKKKIPHIIGRCVYCHKVISDVDLETGVAKKLNNELIHEECLKQQRHWAFSDLPSKKILKQMPLLRYKGINLPRMRPYQAEALQKFLEQRKGVVMYPTATGKTLIALEAIRRIDGDVAIIVPTIAILRTVWLRMMRKAGWVDVGVFYGEKHDVRTITIFTYQSAIRYPHVLYRFAFIIFDEIHHLAAPVYSRLLEHARRAKYALGLTATITRWDPKNKPVLDVMPIIAVMNIAEARKGGWVAPMEVISEEASMSKAERTLYEQYQEAIREAVWSLRTSDPTVWAKLAKEGNVSARKGLWALAKRRTLLSLISDKTRIVINIVDKHPHEKILLFSESIEAIERIQKTLREHDYKCSVYHSKMKRNIREMVLRRWGTDFNILLSVTALEEGLDVPSASVAIIHASGRTPRKIIQRLGRVLRPQPNKVARVYVIFCPGTIETKVYSAVQRAAFRIR